MNITRKLCQSILAGALVFTSYTSTQASRVPVSQGLISDTIRQLDIMVGNSAGDMYLDKEVNRAEFATMLVAASPYKNTSTNFGFTLFPDVPAKHWASGYIKVAVEQGYMVGQLNGNFSPDRTVLLEEAVTAILHLLGYNGETLTGTYPQAQLKKYYELELNTYLDAKAGSPLTREDCMYLFFNLLNTETLNGGYYASTMGYAMDSNGNIDTIALNQSKTQGPFVVGTSALPTVVDTVALVYRNDKASLDRGLEHYDICYYNEKLNTLWIYDEKVTGRITEIDDFYNPSQITLSGKSYTLENTTVKYKLSAGGDYEEGDYITLLLGKYGQVADVAPASVMDSIQVGIVLQSGVGEFSDSHTDSSLSRYSQMITPAGDIIEVETQGKYYEGRLLELSYDNGIPTVKAIADKSISGTINDKVTRLGDYTLAEDLHIIEFTEGNYTTIYPSRLAGATLKKEDVRYYTTNDKGEIDNLMLEDVTGDAAQYVYISSKYSYPSYMGTFSPTMYYLYSQGQYQPYLADQRDLRGEPGAAYFHYEDGEATALKNLEEMTVSSITDLRASAQGKVVDFADEMQVYEKFKDTYVLRDVAAVKDLEKYTLTAYYDSGIFSAGGKIRVMVAEAK